MSKTEPITDGRVLRLDSARNFRIAAIVGDQCTIVTQDDRTVFVGTMRQCEDWLDACENCRAGTSRSTSWFSRIWRVGMRSLARNRR